MPGLQLVAPRIRDQEGKSGLQSIPTRFHPHVWAWWPLPDFDGFTQYNEFRAEWEQC